MIPNGVDAFFNEIEKRYENCYFDSLKSKDAYDDSSFRDS